MTDYEFRLACSDAVKKMNALNKMRRGGDRTMEPVLYAASHAAQDKVMAEIERWDKARKRKGVVNELS